MTGKNFAISTKGLSKSFGERVAVHPLTLEVEHGEVFGFLGHNGAGKTTTIRMLTTLIKPSSGNATVGGHDLMADPLRLKSEIGYLPENVRLYDRFTTEENLTFFARLSGVQNSKEVIADTLEFLNITHLANLNIGTFSKGMRQRVGLAQAILHRPSILFLDEPTSGLDPIGVLQLREIIERLASDGMTIFMNTHVLSEVAKSCSSIGVLAHGKLVFHERIDAFEGRLDDKSLEALYVDLSAKEVA